MDLIKKMQDFCKSVYPTVDYAYTTIPTYPSGQIGFVLCSNSPVSDLSIFQSITPSITLKEKIKKEKKI